MPKRWKTSSNTKRLIPSEHAEQATLIAWAEIAQGHRPLLGMLYAVPNGGQRSLSVAIALKKEGLKPGVPDLCLPVARCGHHGLYLEMKAQDGRLSAVQKRWRDMLISQGYGVAVAKSFEEAKQILEDYLDDKWKLDNEQFEQKPGD